jgi:uncharacterized membrane protein YfcA
VFVAYFIFGVSGFGSSIIAVPILVLFFPLQIVVPLMVILDLCAAFYLGGKSYQEADKKELTWLFPFTLVGMVIGITLLLNAPQKPLLVLLGMFAAGNGIRVLTRSQSKPIPIISRYWAIPFGVVGGVFTALYATGGAIYASYLSMRLDQATRLRATMALAILVLVFMRLIFMLFSGLILYMPLFMLGLALIPCLIAGLWLGSKAHRNLSMHRMQQAYGLILLFAGSVLLLKQAI